MPFAKAIVAFVTPLILTLVAPLGIGAETSFGDALYLLMSAALTGIAVYTIPNRG